MINYPRKQMRESFCSECGKTFKDYQVKITRHFVSFTAECCGLSGTIISVPKIPEEKKKEVSWKDLLNI